MTDLLADQAATVFTAVCRFDDLLPERGVAALVDGRQVAIFRCHDDAVYAVGQRDPFSGANVMSRGIVGSRGESATVASPMFKQAFDLVTGVCLDAPDDPSVRIPVYPVRIRAGVVEVAGIPVAGTPVDGASVASAPADGAPG
jgi:nitrite reductase (NADH) small subunit